MLLKRLWHRPELKKIGFVGWLEVREVLADGSKRLVLRTPNTIVNNGIAQAILQMGDGAAEAFTKGTIGTGTTAPTIADAALETPVDSQNVTFTREMTAIANDTGKYVSTHTAPVGGWAITEYALKTATGPIFNRVTFAAINLAEANQLEFTYKVQGQRV